MIVGSGAAGGMVAWNLARKGINVTVMDAGESHDVKNLFVVDGAAFTTASEKNPTLTILALSWRATDYLAEEMRAGRV